MINTRLYSLSFAALGAGAIVAISTNGRAFAQVTGSLPAYIKLQSATPGTAQTGHSNITGTARASQFVGGGAGLSGLNAASIASGTLSDARLSANVARRDEANLFGVGPNQFNGFLGVGRDFQVTGAESFGVGNDSLGFDGMYVRTGPTGLPFYGYSVDGDVTAYHFIDSGDAGKWKFVLGGDYRMTLDTTGNLGLGTTNPESKVDALAVSTPYAGRFVNENADGSSGGVFASGTGSGGVFQATSNDGIAVQGSSPGVGGKFFSTGTGIGLIAGTDTTSTNAMMVRGAGYGSSPGSLYANAVGDFSDSGAIYARSVGTFGFGINSNAHYPENGWSIFLDVAGGFINGSSTRGSAVAAQTANPNAYGVFAAGAGSGANVALRANGNTQATGTKSFIIDHPLDPENKTLKHFCSEGPEPTNVYSGMVRLGQDGTAWVDLPNYFESINKDCRYQLTCVGGFAQVFVATEVMGNRFQIGGGRAGLKVSWQVTATRNDAYVRHYGYKVEEMKPEEERGFYLTPEAYGAPETKSVMMTQKIIKNPDGSKWVKGKFVPLTSTARP